MPRATAAAGELRLGDDPGRGAHRRHRWKTSLWPKDGGYIVPIKDDVRRAEGLELGADHDDPALRRRLTVAGPPVPARRGGVCRGAGHAAYLRSELR